LLKFLVLNKNKKRDERHSATKAQKRSPDHLETLRSLHQQNRSG